MATSIHQLRHPSGVLSRSITANFQPKQVENGSKVNFFLIVFVLPRDFRRQQTAKSKHIFEIEEGKRGVEVVGCLPFGVPTCTGFRGLRTCRRLALVLLSCVPLLLSSFSPCSRCIVFEYGSISHSKGVFSEVWGVCVGLCCLGGLRGLWGFCVRERLGGFRACGVFASVFLFCPILFLCSFSFRFVCPSLLWLSFFVLLHCLCGSLGVVVVFFSLAD